MVLRRNDKGFILIETLVAFLLFLILIIPCYSLFHFAFKTYSFAEETTDELQNLRIAMEGMAKNVRESKGLVARAPSIRADEQNLLLLTREGDTIWYYIIGNTLRWAKMEKGTRIFQGHNPVADKILKLKFTYDDAEIDKSNTVKISLTGISNKGELNNLITIIKLRNN